MGMFGLFMPAWNSKNPEKRLAAVAAIAIETDSGIKKLRKVAEKTAHDDARQAAWKCLALEVTGWKYSDLRHDAVAKIIDEIVLVKVALHDESKLTRDKAIEKITEQQLVMQIAMSEILTLAEASEHYRAMLLQLASQRPLPDVKDTERKGVSEQGQKWSGSGRQGKGRAKADCPASSCGSGAQRYLSDKVRLAALEKITQQDIFKKVALNGLDVNIRREAVRKITDQAFLRKVVLSNEDAYVCKQAIKSITDQQFLCETIKTGGDLASIALERLMEIFHNSDSQSIIPETVEMVVDALTLGWQAKEILPKILEFAHNNLEQFKAFYPKLKAKITPWHEDAKHLDTGHTDGFYSAPVSNDCVHVDKKEHTDKKHADTHVGKSYLATFPPFFKD